ncbi:AraC family transcriptional regulator [Nostoc sp. UHCC 0926]|uniref:AraC family transcriptional regulator n=1 Tax=unclassified Nostoc TaxID=2593658 RepID=UPI002361D4A0|nr:AraC family transcriptional regulator [Nostoc sp. UHCC 0926]WDD31974.1 AraC family transcriptional regulator [Nostoc sp. UHCC 0926]
MIKPFSTEKLSTIRQELVEMIGHIVGTAEDYATDIPGLILYRFTAPTTAASVTYEPNLAVVVQGRKRVDLGPKTFIYDASQYLLTSVDLPVLGQVVEASEEKPYLCLVLKLEMLMVREILSRDDIPDSDASSDGPAMLMGDNTAELLGACSRLLDLLDSPHDIPFLSGLIQREIVYRLLRGPEGARLRAIAMQGCQSNRTAKAIAWIRANYMKPLRVEELAQLAGMGLSTFHHHFKALTTLSPLQFQKGVRLHIARNRMLIDGLDAASAAFEVGYESASQFNREYSRYFGQPPKRDIQNLRSTVY